MGHVGDEKQQVCRTPHVPENQARSAQRTCSTSSSLSTPMARMTATMFTSSLLW